MGLQLSCVGLPSPARAGEGLGQSSTGAEGRSSTGYHSVSMEPFAGNAHVCGALGQAPQSIQNSWMNRDHTVTIPSC